MLKAPQDNISISLKIYKFIGFRIKKLERRIQLLLFKDTKTRLLEFLDELCEMDLDLQSKLLRFIQLGTYQKVGSSISKQVDIRFVCATNREPLEEVRLGRFREDLYYQLKVVVIDLPPLRDRPGDIPLLMEHFLKDLSKKTGRTAEGFSRTARRALLSYNWPGNIRQLRNAIESMLVNCENTSDLWPSETSSLICGIRKSSFAKASFSSPRFNRAGWQAACRSRSSASSTCILLLASPSFWTAPNSDSR